MQRGAGEAWQEACSNLTELRSGAWAAGPEAAGGSARLGHQGAEHGACRVLPPAQRSRTPAQGQRAPVVGEVLVPPEGPLPSPLGAAGVGTGAWQWPSPAAAGASPGAASEQLRLLNMQQVLYSEKFRRNFLCLHVNVGRCCPD